MRVLVMNFKVILILSITLLVAQVHAGTIGKGKSAKADSSRLPIAQDGVMTIPGANTTTVSEGSGAGKSCVAPLANGYVSQNFIKNLVDPSESPNEIKIVKNREGVFDLQIPTHIKACTNLEAEIVKAGNDYFVRIQNNFHYEPRMLGVNNETASKMSMNQKFNLCIEKQGLLIDGSFDRTKAQENREIATTTFAFRVYEGGDHESANIYFGSPDPDVGYGYANRTSDIDARPSGWNCMVYENIGGDSPMQVYKSKEDRLTEEAQKACESEDPVIIMQALRDFKDAGNYAEVAPILEDALEKLREKEVATTYDEKQKRINQILQEMHDINRATKRSKDDGPISEEAVADYAEQFVVLANELDRISLQPAIESLKNLEKMTPTKSTPQREIDKKIKDHRTEIGKYYKKFNSIKKPSFLLTAMEKHGIVDEAAEIHKVWLTSRYYGGKGERGPIKTATARKIIEKKEEQYQDRILAEWELNYEARNGSTAPLDAEKRKIRALNKKLTEQELRYRKEKSQCKTYCSNNWFMPGRNPVRCNRCRKNASQMEKSFMKKRTSLLSQQRSSAVRAGRFQSSLDDYLDRHREEEGDYRGYDDSDYNYYDTDNYSFSNSGNSSNQNDMRYNLQNQGQGMFRAPGNQHGQPQQSPMFQQTSMPNFYGMQMNQQNMMYQQPMQQWYQQPVQSNWYRQPMPQQNGMFNTQFQQAPVLTGPNYYR